MDTMKIHDVIVVGAGLSGLAAAKMLEKNGLSTIILEAQNRIGGRVHSVEVDGTIVDLGGQWVGPTQDKLLGLIKEFGLEMHPQYNQGKSLIYVGGKRRTLKGIFPSMKMRENVEFFTQIGLMELASTLSGDVDKAPQKWPYTALDSLTIQDYADKTILQKNVRALFETASQVILSADPSEVSFLYFLHYLKSGGGFQKLADVKNAAQENRVVGGTQQIIEKMAEKLSADIRTDSPVKSVEYTDDKVIVTTEEETFLAKKLLLALSPTMISKISFTPELPKSRQNLHQEMKMGSVLKSVFGFERPFWREQGVTGEAVITEGPIQTVFDNCNGGVDQMPQLVTFSTGKEAKKLGQLTQEQRKLVIQKELVRLYGEKASEYVFYVEKDWNKEPWINGCYVAIAGTETLTRFGGRLSQAHGPIHFAGTETAMKWRGYMDGALRSGEREAKKIAKAIKG